MASNLKVIDVPINDLIEYENNPRENEDAAAKVAQSIIEFDFLNPIAITPDKVVIAGHARLKAARKLELKTVPCIVHDISEEDAVIARIAENRTHEFATWDTTKLINGLKGINIATKNAFFAPIGRDRQFYAENKILSFGKVEINITPEDEEIFEEHFNAYIDKHGSHLGFVNYLIGGLLDA